jgi:hypothetical protein
MSTASCEHEEDLSKHGQLPSGPQIGGGNSKVRLCTPATYLHVVYARDSLLYM